MVLKGAIFDLDGVLVDTAKYHFLAWSELANRLKIPFTKEDNERLKGVSRIASLEILLSLSSQNFTQSEKEKFLEEKNNRYIQLINEMRSEEILPGVIALLKCLKERGIKIALGSASKNAPLILEKTNLESFFDVIVDGNSVGKAKPDPEVFTYAAECLDLKREHCIVFEDALAGVEAGKAANMVVIAIGEKGDFPNADETVSNLLNFKVASYF